MSLPTRGPTLPERKEPDAMGAMAWTHEFLAWVFIVALAQFIVRRWRRR